MHRDKKEHPKIKSQLHPRSKHKERYHFKELVKSHAALEPFITINQYGDEHIDFFNAEAVKALNKSLLLHFYNLSFWDLPKNYLCPPIPGRADYIHLVADLLASSNSDKIPIGNKIRCLDIGMGANCIYPIIGKSEYGWSFIGSDIDPVAIENANKIIDNNPNLKGRIECRLQQNPKQILKGVLQEGERIDLTVCNPPFHASLKQAQDGSIRKLSNLKKKKIKKAELNFGGQGNELWTPGGEKRFIFDMIKESAGFAKSVCWFTTLVSKEENLQPIFEALDFVEATAYETIRMSQGNKSSRIVAWTFLSKKEETDWAKARWW